MWALNQFWQRISAPPLPELAIAAILLPVALWVVISKITENNPERLLPIYDVVEKLTWCIWLADAGLLVYCLNPRPATFHSMRLILTILAFGVQSVYIRIRRRVDPGVRHPGYGWWPTAK
jgi:hypothetical protein